MMEEWEPIRHDGVKKSENRSVYHSNESLSNQNSI